VCVCACVCSSDSQMIDMCRTSTTYTDQHGAYLVTPDFPFSYSAGRHCSCTLQTAADGDGSQLALEFVHVRLRQRDPALCHDWIDVQVVLDLCFNMLIYSGRLSPNNQGAIPPTSPFPLPFPFRLSPPFPRPHLPQSFPPLPFIPLLPRSGPLETS